MDCHVAGNDVEVEPRHPAPYTSPVIASRRRGNPVGAGNTWARGLLRRCAPGNDVEVEPRHPAPYTSPVIASRRRDNPVGAGNAWARGLPRRYAPRNDDRGQQHRSAQHTPSLRAKRGNPVRAGDPVAAAWHGAKSLAIRRSVISRNGATYQHHHLHQFHQCACRISGSSAEPGAEVMAYQQPDQQRQQQRQQPVPATQ